MAEEFFSVMKGYSEAPLKERVEGLADVIEKIMTITLKIPEMVDQSLNAIDGRLKAMEGRIVQVESRVAASAGAGFAVPAVASGPGSSPGKGGPPPGPVSLRGSIMDELKSLFSKRKALSE